MRFAGSACMAVLVLALAEAASQLATGGATLLRYRPHPTLLWEIVPGQKNVWMRGARGIGINSFGMRGHEVTVGASAGTTRIAVVGDSATFGHGLATGETYPERLEALLEETAPPGLRFAVLNFAVPGYSTWQTVESVRTKALSFHPELVLLPTTFNEGWQMNEKGMSEVRDRFLRGWLAKDVLKRSSAFTLILSAAQETAIRGRGALDLPPSGPLPHDFLESYREDLVTALGWIRNAGAVPIMATLPTRGEVVGNPGPPFVAERQRIMREVAAEAGAPLADLVLTLKGSDAVSLYLASDEVHPSALGASRIASALAPTILSTLKSRAASGPASRVP